eukprot:Rmarinus@m.21611
MMAAWNPKTLSNIHEIENLSKTLAEKMARLDRLVKGRSPLPTPAKPPHASEDPNGAQTVSSKRAAKSTGPVEHPSPPSRRGPGWPPRAGTPPREKGYYTDEAPRDCAPMPPSPARSAHTADEIVPRDRSVCKPAPSTTPTAVTATHPRAAFEASMKPRDCRQVGAGMDGVAAATATADRAYALVYGHEDAAPQLSSSLRGVAPSTTAGRPGGAVAPKFAKERETTPSFGSDSTKRALFSMEHGATSTPGSVTECLRDVKESMESMVRETQREAHASAGQYFGKLAGLSQRIAERQRAKLVSAQMLLESATQELDVAVKREGDLLRDELGHLRQAYEERLRVLESDYRAQLVDLSKEFEVRARNAQQQCEDNVAREVQRLVVHLEPACERCPPPRPHASYLHTHTHQQAASIQPCMRASGQKGDSWGGDDSYVVVGRSPTATPPPTAVQPPVPAQVTYACSKHVDLGSRNYQAEHTAVHSNTLYASETSDCQECVPDTPHDCNRVHTIRRRLRSPDRRLAPPKGRSDAVTVRRKERYDLGNAGNEIESHRKVVVVLSDSETCSDSETRKKCNRGKNALPQTKLSKSGVARRIAVSQVRSSGSRRTYASERRHVSPDDSFESSDSSVDANVLYQRTWAIMRSSTSERKGNNRAMQKSANDRKSSVATKQNGGSNSTARSNARTGLGKNRRWTEWERTKGIFY